MSHGDSPVMTNQTQPLSLTRTRSFDHQATRRRVPLTRDDLLGLLMFPFNLLAAVAAIAYWIVAALIRGGGEA